MIPVERVPEPPDFDARVRNAPALRVAFKDLCGYTAMWLSAPGTVDHFVSRDEDRSLAYEWTNFRYAAAWINSSKSALRSDQVLDPFEVEQGWFEVLLPSCQMVMTSRCPPELRDRAQTMLKRLRLGDGEDVVRYRQEWYRMYCEGELTLDGLARKAPLIARAIQKHAQQRVVEPISPPPSQRDGEAGGE